MRVCDMMRGADLFKGLGEAQLNRIGTLGRQISVKAGDEIGGPDELSPSLFVVTAGRVQISFQTRMGDLSVRIIGTGDSFPLVGLLDSRGLITTAKAMTDVDLFGISLAPFLELCSMETQIGMRVYKNTAQSLANRYGDVLGQLAATTEQELLVGEFSSNPPRTKCKFCGGTEADGVDLYPVGKHGYLQPICSQCVASWTGTLRAAASRFAEDAARDEQGRG